jgi:hypothetical protein
MAKKKLWMKKDEFSPVVAHMLRVFESVFGLHGSGYIVTYFRDDAVFVTVMGFLDCYRMARMVVQFPEIGFDVEATAPGFVTIRMFKNETEKEWNKRRLPDIQVPVTIPEWTDEGNVWVRADARN